jgi:hypothetical protein
MARIQKPAPARLVISVLHSSRDALADALRQLERRFGRVQAETVDIPHTTGREYAEEMGTELQRRFFSFERTVPREGLIEIKASCHKLESQLGDQVHDFTFRTVNLDPGVLTPANLVMSSHKEGGHKIYLGEGVFSEVALIWSRGQFCRLPWTNLDYCHDDAIDFFLRVRSSLEPIEENAPVSTGRKVS